MSATRPTPADVREFAAANDLPAGGSRGRLPSATIEAFNKGRKVKYVPNTPKVVSVTGKRVGKDGRSRPVTLKVNPADVRAAASAAGLTMPERGRLSSKVTQAFVAGTLNDLATA